MRTYSTWLLLNTSQVLVTLFVEERIKLVRPDSIPNTRHIPLHNRLCSGSQATQHIGILAYIRHFEP